MKERADPGVVPDMPAEHVADADQRQVKSRAGMAACVLFPAGRNARRQILTVNSMAQPVAHAEACAATPW